MKKAKRLLALVTALVMTMSLAACGEKADTTEMVNAFQAANAAYEETAALIHDNTDKIDEQTIADYKQISDSLAQLKTQIENESITQEEADAVTEILKPMPEYLKTIKAGIETIIGAADAAALPAGITQTQLDELRAVLAEIDPLYNEAANLAEKNGWLADEKTNQELTALAGALDATEAAIADPTQFVEGDVPAYTANLKKLIPLVAPITERVSVPYEGPQG